MHVRIGLKLLIKDFELKGHPGRQIYKSFMRHEEQGVQRGVRLELDVSWAKCCGTARDVAQCQWRD